MLVEPVELAKHLKSDNLRILDTRSKQNYAKAHIPGAIWVNVTDWKSLAKSKGGFHNTKAWSEKVGRLGIDRSTKIVVYGDSLSNTARIWWLLKYLGLKDVRIVNGGWQVWTTEKQPTATATPKLVRKHFQPSFQKDRLEEIATLKRSIGSEKVKVVDTRSNGEFTGKVKRGKRGGHIPGATLLEWKELLAKDGRFKTKSQLQQLFRKHGILPKQTVVCY